MAAPVRGWSAADALHERERAPAERIERRAHRDEVRCELLQLGDAKLTRRGCALCFVNEEVGVADDERGAGARDLPALAFAWIEQQGEGCNHDRRCGRERC